MTRFLRDFRLVPIVLLATISLFALKTIGLVIDGHYTLDPAVDDAADITGSVAARSRLKIRRQRRSCYAVRIRGWNASWRRRAARARFLSRRAVAQRLLARQTRREESACWRRRGLLWPD